MISFLRGKLVDALPTHVVIEVAGIGYDVLIPVSSFSKLPPLGAEVKLLTHLAIRDDAHVLYGFISLEERELFRLLIDTVSGIGPKIALNVLSGTNPSALRAAVASGDVKSLSQISGVGKKTAERIVLELKDKMGIFTTLARPTGHSPLPMEDQTANDAILALTALGFKQPEAFEAIRSSQALLGKNASVEALVRASLKKPG